MIIILLSIILLIGYCSINYMYKKMWDKGISVDIKLKPLSLVEGTVGELTETVTNDKNMPIPNLNVRFNISSKLTFFDKINSSSTDRYYRDDIFSLPGNKIIKRRLKFTAEKRGVCYIDHTYIVTKGIFFDRTLSKKLDNKSCMVYIYPRVLKSFEIPISVNNDITNFINFKSLYEDPFSVCGLRQYQSYDSMKRINWKSSAKNNKLMVNQYDTITSLNIDILFNASLRNFGLEELGEYGIRAALTIIYKSYKLGIPVNLESNACNMNKDENIKVSAKNTTSNRRLVNESLAKIDFTKIHENFIKTMKRYNIKNKHKLIIISSDIDNELFEEFIKIKKVKKDNVLYVVPVQKGSSISKIYRDAKIVFWEVL